MRSYPIKDKQNSSAVSEIFWYRQTGIHTLGSQSYIVILQSQIVIIQSYIVIIQSQIVIIQSYIVIIQSYIVIIQSQIVITQSYIVILMLQSQIVIIQSYIVRLQSQIFKFFNLKYLKVQFYKNSHNSNFFPGIGKILCKNFK